jgi:prepilin-type N-terminal cleavage/methylation domain-containing protein
MQPPFAGSPGHVRLGMNTDYKETSCSPRAVFSQEAEPRITPIAPVEMDRSNKTQIRQMTRIFFCRGSRVGCDSPVTSVKERGSDGALRSQLSTINSQRSRAAFTLIELLVVMAIIAILLALVAPAFTSLKSAGDITSATYTIKGALDTARTHAKANNTYTWVGFAGSIGTTIRCAKGA